MKYSKSKLIDGDKLSILGQEIQEIFIRENLTSADILALLANLNLHVTMVSIMAIEKNDQP